MIANTKASSPGLSRLFVHSSVLSVKEKLLKEKMRWGRCERGFRVRLTFVCGAAQKQTPSQEPISATLAKEQK
jgi:hypothetical protein